MIKLRTMIPIVTALTLSTAALPACDTIRPVQNGKTELLNKEAETDTFQSTGKTDKKYTLEIILGVLGSIGAICLLHAIKKPDEFRRHILNKHNDNEEKPNQ